MQLSAWRNIYDQWFVSLHDIRAFEIDSAWNSNSWTPIMTANPQTMLILRGIAGHFAGKDWPRGALDEPPALEYARLRGYVGEVLDVDGATGPNSPQVRMCVEAIRDRDDIAALYGFSGGGYNLRRVLAELSSDERKRIKLVVVLGAPKNPPELYHNGPWELVYRDDPPQGHMAGPKELLADLIATEMRPQPSASAAPASMEDANALEESTVVTTLIGPPREATRNQPISDELKQVLDSAARAAGIDTIRITSGGQDALGHGTRRTGSTRHDRGRAADLQCIVNGTALTFTDHSAHPDIVAFVTAAAAAGATGIGAGVGYMGDRTIHVGFGTSARDHSHRTWGAGGRSANAPKWLRDAAAAGWASLAPVVPASALRLDAPGRYAVVARDGLKLRAGPGINFESNETLPAGTELNVVDDVSDEDPSWVRVDLQGDGLLDGYVFGTFLAPLAIDTYAERAPEPDDDVGLEVPQPGIATRDGYRPPAGSQGILTGVPFQDMTRVGEKYVNRFERWDQSSAGKKDPSLCHGIYRHSSGAIFWESKMAVDADGSSTPSVLASSSGSAENTSYMFRHDAAPVNAEIVPYYVLPDIDSLRRVRPGKPWEGSGDDFCADFGITKGTLGVVIFGDKITGAIFADRGPAMKIGEASIRVHELIRKPPAPWRGDPANKILRDVSEPKGVLYFVFPGTHFDIDQFGEHRQAEMAAAIHEAAMREFDKLKAASAPGIEQGRHDVEVDSPASETAAMTFVCEASGDPEAADAAVATAAAPQKPRVDRVVETTHQSSRKGRKIDHVVIHYTTSRNINGSIEHFKSGSPRTSAHYIVGQDGELVQVVPDEKCAWHAGDTDMNLRSIGIEHVAARGDRITPDQEQTSLALIRWLMTTYNIPVNQIIPHCCVHSTSCCGDLFKDYGGGWNLSCTQQTSGLRKWLAARGTSGQLIASAPPAEPAVGSQVVEARVASTPAASTPAALRPIDRLRPLETSVSDVSMEPRLHRLMNVRASGRAIETSASTDENEVAVLAVVSNKDKWRDNELVRMANVIGPAFDRDGKTDHFVVTGRVAAHQLARLREERSLVLSLKASQPVHQALSVAVPDVGARPIIRNIASRGAGVVVGIVDTGCDFAHENFIVRTQGNPKSRIEAIWHQGGALDPNRAVPYGRLYTANEIEAALSAADPYTALGYGPGASASPGTHGTHVMDIAAGSGGGSGVVGMASDATILFVDLASDDVPWSGAVRVGKKFGDSVHLAEAVSWIFDRAGNRPCVINISLGTNGGPHDGSNPFERAVDGLLHEKPDRAVVIAASNSHADQIHAKASVAAANYKDLRMVTPRNAESEVEVWYNSAARLDMELFSPDGNSLGRIQPGNEGRVDDNTGDTVVFIASRTQDPANGDNTIGVYLSKKAPPGAWTLRLHNTGAATADMHAWIERNDLAQCRFVREDADPDYTLGSISCGYSTITVASYDAHDATRTISNFSSGGPTRDDRQKPEIAAPGSDVLAAQSETRIGVVNKSGTSMAAPMVTGAIAILLGEAKQRGQSLDIQKIRQTLTDHTRPSPVAGGWDKRYGFGNLSIGALAAWFP